MKFSPATPDPRRLLVTLAAAGALLFVASAVTGSLGTTGVAAAPAEAPATASTACPAGQIREQDTSLATYVTSGLVGTCTSVLHAEGSELDAANTSLTERATGGETAVKPGAYAAAVASKQRIAATSTAPESTTPWTPLGTGAELEVAMDVGVRIAVDVSHLHIQETSGVLSDRVRARLYDYARVEEIHVSHNDGRADQHRPIEEATPGLPWARTRGDLPVVLESRFHRATDDERRRQVDLVRA